MSKTIKWIGEDGKFVEGSTGAFDEKWIVFSNCRARQVGSAWQVEEKEPFASGTVPAVKGEYTDSNGHHRALFLPLEKQGTVDISLAGARQMLIAKFEIDYAAEHKAGRLP